MKRLVGLILFAISLVAASPCSAQVLSGGDLIVGDGTSPPSIFRVDPASGHQTMITAGSFLGINAFGVALDLDGSILAIGRSPAAVVRVDPDDGSSAVVAFTTSQFAFPGDLAVSVDGQVFVRTLDNQVFRVDTSTGDSFLISAAFKTTSNRQAEIEVDRHDGSLIVAVDQAILRMDPVTGAAQTIKPVRAWGIAIDPEGNVLYSKRGGLGADGIYRVHRDTGAESLLLGVTNVTGLDVEANGSVVYTRDGQPGGGVYRLVAGSGSPVAVGPDLWSNSQRDLIVVMPIINVPSLQPIGLTLLSALILAAGVVSLRIGFAQHRT